MKHFAGSQARCRAFDVCVLGVTSEFQANFPSCRYEFPTTSKVARALASAGNGCCLRARVCFSEAKIYKKQEFPGILRHRFPGGQ